MGVPQSVRSLGVLALGTGVAGGIGYRVPEQFAAVAAPLAGVAAVVAVGWLLTDGRYVPLCACLATVAGGVAVATTVPSRAESGWLVALVGVGGLAVRDGIVGLGRVAAAGGFSERRRGRERLLYPFGLVLYGISSLVQAAVPQRRDRMLLLGGFACAMAALDVGLAAIAPSVAPLAVGLAVAAALVAGLDAGNWAVRGGPRSASALGVLRLAVASVRGFSLPAEETGATATASTTAGGQAGGDAVVDGGTSPEGSHGGHGTSASGSARSSPSAPDGDDACQNCGASDASADTSAERVVPGFDRGEDVRVPLCTRCRNARGFVGDRPVDACRRRDGAFAGVLREHEPRCYACGATAGDGTDLEGHSVVPLELRGHAHSRNVVPLCRECHEAAH